MREAFFAQSLPLLRQSCTFASAPGDLAKTNFQGWLLKQEAVSCAAAASSRISPSVISTGPRAL